jgi:hypothetical protein
MRFGLGLGLAKSRLKSFAGSIPVNPFFIYVTADDYIYETAESEFVWDQAEHMWQSADFPWSTGYIYLTNG